MLKQICVFLFVLFSLPLYADTLNDRPYYIGAYGGYGTINGAYQQDGQTPFGRLALGKLFQVKSLGFLGGEVGVQSGNTMRLSTSQSNIDTAGGLPISATLKPFIDVLVVAKGPFQMNSALFYTLKGGIAYRQLGLNNTISSNDYLQDVSGEVQAGLGWKFNEHILINVFYQGIYATSSAGIQLDGSADILIYHIPMQQAGLIGAEYLF